MADVFLSYQKLDRELAERMAAGLRAEGLTVWWDDDLTPRESWDRIIEREIAAAHHVLVLWTKSAVQSDWVRIEANYARNCQPCKLVQARFDDAPIPMAFSMVQFVDLVSVTPDRGPAWRKLVSWLEMKEDDAVAVPAKQTFVQAPSPVARPVASPVQVRQMQEPGSPTSRPEPLLPYAMLAPNITRMQTLRWLLVGAALFVAARCIWVRAIPSNPIPENIAYIAPLFGLPFLFKTWQQPGRIMRLVYFIVMIPIANVATVHFNFQIGFKIYRYFDYYIFFVCGVTGGLIYSIICFGLSKAMRGVPEGVNFAKTLAITSAVLAAVGSIILHTSMYLPDALFDGGGLMADITFVIILYGGWHGTAAWCLSRLLAPPNPGT